MFSSSYKLYLTSLPLIYASLIGMKQSNAEKLMHQHLATFKTKKVLSFNKLSQKVRHK